MGEVTFEKPVVIIGEGWGGMLGGEQRGRRKESPSQAIAGGVVPRVSFPRPPSKSLLLIHTNSRVVKGVCSKFQDTFITLII